MRYRANWEQTTAEGTRPTDTQVMVVGEGECDWQQGRHAGELGKMKRKEEERCKRTWFDYLEKEMPHQKREKNEKRDEQPLTNDTVASRSTWWCLRLSEWLYCTLYGCILEYSDWNAGEPRKRIWNIFLSRQRERAPRFINLEFKNNFKERCLNLLKFCFNKTYSCARARAHEKEIFTRFL